MDRITLFDCFEGEPKRGLGECLQYYWGYRLLELAQAHGLQVVEETPDAEIMDKLIPQMLKNFANDLVYLNEDELLFLNKVKENPNKEMDDAENGQYTTLKWLGYVYLFNFDGHIYPVIPNELLQLIPDMNAEEFKHKVERNQKLLSYTLALTNIYGVYRVEQLVDVWNMLNKEKMDVDEVREYIDIMSARQTNFWCDRGHIVSTLLGDVNEYYDLMKKASRSPYFVPTKTDIGFYSDSKNVYSSTYCKKIEDFIRNKNVIDESQLGDLISEIADACKMDKHPNEIIAMVNEGGIEFSDEEETSEFLRLLMTLSNSTRKWVLRGYMPSELVQNPSRPAVRPLPNKPVQSVQKKVGRNDPCVCGSGKKYKHCCGK
ncbi:SEC-C metal-binding domain-containing protein [Acetivibrio cellulolyticus]|uniref:SEC-C metal-binding domain-containing protein n=1 Tax=Acetivibrio cellulolyticus TaxID=35830 RepID=UPI0001E2BDBA|nr:SEC-C metal-binding domain-containing protein [Acetivibrio cellulolyticus]